MGGTLKRAPWFAIFRPRLIPITHPNMMIWMVARTKMRKVPTQKSMVSRALRSLLKGIGKLELDESAISKDLEDNWAVVAEAIQTILRREGYPNPYEALKDLTRVNEKITKETISRFIDGLELQDEVKQELKNITPFNYTGLKFGK